MVGMAREACVLELGAGTGVITNALLRRGVARERLVVVEKSPAMAELLRRRFAGCRVIEGDAASIEEILRHQLGLSPNDFSHVVSSLPLRSIPRPIAELIAGGLQRFLRDGAHLVQFTYDLRNGSREWYGQLRHVRSSIVLANVPPARVDVYRANRPSISRN